MAISTGYAIASKATLKALTSSQRTDSYARLVRESRAWYIFLADSTETADDDAILTPNDTPATGRWIKSSGSGGGAAFGGEIICTGDCSIGGKAFRFYAPQPTLELEVQVGFDILITPGATNIQIHRWNQTPNTELDGREFAAELPHTGGKVSIEINSTYRWISVFARNPNNSEETDAFDGVCFTVAGNVLTLIGF